MTEPSIRAHLDAGILTIELARPQQLNALTRPMLSELVGALARADDPAVRAVVLTGAGRGFCAGQDLDEVLSDPGDAHGRLRTSYHPAIAALSAVAPPTFAAIDGVCAGAGIALAVACDFRIASSRAVFAPAFINLALVPDAGASWFLTRLLGYGAAARWLLSGHRLDVEEARTLGLVDEVIEGEDFPEAVLRRARDVAQHPRETVIATKALLREATRNSLETQLELEARTQGEANRSAAHHSALDDVRRRREARDAGGG